MRGFYWCLPLCSYVWLEPCVPRPSLVCVHSSLGAFQQKGSSNDCGPAPQIQSTHKSADHVPWSLGPRAVHGLHTQHNAHTHPPAHLSRALAFIALHVRHPIRAPRVLPACFPHAPRVLPACCPGPPVRPVHPPPLPLPRFSMPPSLAAFRPLAPS